MRRTTEHGRDGLRSLRYAELLWFMRLRWVAGTGVSAAGVACGFWYGWAGIATPLSALGATILGYSAALWLFSRGRAGRRLRQRGLLLFAAIQIYLDLGALTALVIITGGLASPVIGFLVFHMVFAGLLQPRVWAQVSAGVAIAMLATALAVGGQWPATQLEALTAGGWVFTLVGTAYLSERIARSMYRREAARLRQNRRLRSMAAKLEAQQAAMIQHEKMAAMGRLAAGVAHEINNPVSNIDSVLQLIERSKKPPRIETIISLREQAKRISSTVRQLTAFAHPDKGRSEIVPINDLVTGALKMLGFDRRLREIELQLDLPDEAGLARVSRQATQQVLMNLVINALDAVEDTTEPRLIVSTDRTGPHCIVKVTDNGCGIPAEHLTRIFDPFFTTKPVGEGTGLGLAISDSLISEQGGRLDVESRNGEGTTFTVRLPAADAADSPSAGDPARIEIAPYSP